MGSGSRRALGYRADHAVRCGPPCRPLRRRGQAFRSAELAGEEGRQEVRPLHPVRGGRGGHGDGRVRARRRAGQRGASRRHHRQRHRRVRGHREGAPPPARARARPRLAFLHPLFDRQPRRRAGVGTIRRQGTELGGGDRLHDRRACHRRRLPPRRARLRRRDDLRRRRSSDHAARRRRLRGDARALDPQRRPAEKASRPWDVDRDGFVVGEGAGILVIEDRGPTPLAAARRSWPRSSATA